MAADTTGTTTAPSNGQAKPLSEEDILAQEERHSGFLVLRKVAPYLWPHNMPWVKKRVVWAMVVLFVAKLVSVATPLFYRDAVDALAGEGVPLVALGAIGLTIAYGMARLMTFSSCAMRFLHGWASGPFACWRLRPLSIFTVCPCAITSRARPAG
jgi:hypothetical protein